MAFDSRFTNTWRSRVRSPCTAGSGDSCQSISRPWVSAASSLRASTSTRSSGTRLRRSSVRPSREKSSRASIRLPIRLTAWPISFRCVRLSSSRSSRVSPSGAPDSSRYRKLEMWRSGVRRSCETEYENASSSWLAFSSSWVRAFTRSSSSAFSRRTSSSARSRSRTRCSSDSTRLRTWAVIWLKVVASMPISSPLAHLGPGGQIAGPDGLGGARQLAHRAGDLLAQQPGQHQARPAAPAAGWRS